VLDRQIAFADDEVWKPVSSLTDAEITVHIDNLERGHTIDRIGQPAGEMLDRLRIELIIREIDRS